MKRIKFSNKPGSFIVDDSDYADVKLFNWSTNGDKKQIHSRIGGKVVAIANYIMNDYESVFDHIDRNFLNNSRINYRRCSQSQNMANRDKAKDAVYSKHKGVTWDMSRNKWLAQITVKNKHIFIGRFNNEIDAAKAYNQVALKYFGEFAVLNILEENSID
jgi:hypothetical protein